MQLAEILPHLIYQFKNERELLDAIEELSLKFTQAREQISDYLQEPRLTAAYTAFYLTTNIPKLKAVTGWLPAGWTEVLKACDFIDLGAGPGTFSLAWRELIGASEADFFQLENSAVMRQQALKLWQGLYPETPLKQGSRFSGQGDRPRFVLFGHSANEMGAQRAIDYLEQISPEHILFIEPGTKAFFPEMLKLRSHLLRSGYRVLYPCPTAATCPMSDSEDWCHQFIHVQQDPEVERLSQMVRKDRKLLPLTVHAYSRSWQAPVRDRLVRVHPETKFSYEWEVCTPGQERNQLLRYQLMKRGLTKEQQKKLSTVLAGGAVAASIEKDMGQTKRIKLTTLS
jgi:ribosomal protein RSM22 (predicted rRNA methylase)